MAAHMQQLRGKGVVPSSATEWQGILDKARAVQSVIAEQLFGSEGDQYKKDFKAAFYSHRNDPDKKKPASRKMAERNAKLTSLMSEISNKFPTTSRQTSAQSPTS